ncbi:MAG: hypothetical protein AVO35_11990 [Candidatus Aegiribacteria sp. MLS_C]|nr:MAG: hypothetical protein AVO35_11990 [Candidatus Aegiribacteria sp. MLS_C]
MIPIKEAHLFIEGGGDQEVVDETIQVLPREYVEMLGPRICRHDVEDWPEEPFSHAALVLDRERGIRLTLENCLIRDGSTCGKRLYLVMLK